MPVFHADTVFAPIDQDLHLERVAGGNETEVYCTDDRRYVVKLKSDLGSDWPTVVNTARQIRAAAEQFSAALGHEHSIPSYYLISRDNAGLAQLLVIQPFLQDARPLYALTYASLSRTERQNLAMQLREIIRRALVLYQQTGQMPDLYGRSSASALARKRLNAPYMLPWRLWSFLIQRNLLRSHNLVLSGTPEQCVYLVDYDPVRRARLYRVVYYAVRWLLFWRDHALIMFILRR